MKILAILSSPNIDGNSADLARKALSAAKDNGADVLEIFLPSQKIEFCTDCKKCLSTGTCIIKDDLPKIIQEIKSADGIILSTPTYAGGINAMMKRFIERTGLLEQFSADLFGGKYVIGLSTAGGMGAVNTAKNLVKLVASGAFDRAYITGYLGAHLKGSKISQNKKIMDKAYSLGKKIVSDISKKRNYGLQNLYRRFLNSFIIKPMFLKTIISNKNGMTKGVFNILEAKGYLD
jgi:multimeric flavodoxin WrbA